jgi:hypothetical protein
VKPVTVTRRNLLMPIIAAIVPLIVIAGVVTLYFAGGQKSPSAPPSTTASPPAEVAKQAAPEPPKVKPERLSIVVSSIYKSRWRSNPGLFADVITEELTSSLWRIAGSFGSD